MTASSAQEESRFHCNISSALNVVLTVICISGIFVGALYYSNYESPITKIGHDLTKQVDVRFHHHQRHRKQLRPLEVPTNFSDLHCRQPVYDFEKNDLEELLRNYAVFHSEGVRLLLSGETNNVRTLTWNCVSDCGGLGSRFRGFMVNLMYAILTNRVLLFRWASISPVNMFLEPNMIDWRYQNYTFNNSFRDFGYIRRVHFVEPERKVVLDKVIDTLIGPTKHIQMRYNHILKLNRTIFSLVSKANNSKVTKVFEILKKHTIVNLQVLSVSYLFKFSKELQHFASDIRDGLDLHGQGYVALHLRTGQFDDLTEHSNRFATTSFRQYKSIVAKAVKVADEHIGPDAVVVLVSDSRSVKQALTKQFSRVRMLDNLVVHVDKMKHLDSDGMLGTWQDIVIMAESQVLVRGASSFSDISVFFCRIPHSRIVRY